MLAFFNQPLEKTPLTNMELQLTESHYAGVSGYEFNNGNVNGLNDSIPKIRDRNGNEQIQFQNWERKSEVFVLFITRNG